MTSHVAMPSEELEPTTIQADWYYVGHYGQLGPLTLEQMADLARDGVVDRETFVWKQGMADWVKASNVRDLQAHFSPMDLVPPTFGATNFGHQPPPSPGTRPVTPAVAPPTMGFSQPVSQVNPAPFVTMQTHSYGFYMQPMSMPKSDKSRIAAALLSVIIPGGGRFYLGYAAHGALQLITSFCGLGFLWSWIDAVFILCGGVKYDGYGRTLD